MKNNKLLLVLIYVLLVGSSCSKDEDSPSSTSVVENGGGGGMAKTFTKKFYTQCSANFVYSISYNNNTSFVVPVGTTSLGGGCSSAMNLSFFTEVQYKFSIGNLSTTGIEYVGYVVFHDNDGEILLDVQNEQSQQSHNLVLKNSCGSETPDIVIQ